jgi:hypothetical protein
VSGRSNKPSFNYIVCGYLQAQRHCEAESFGGLKIDHEFKFDRFAVLEARLALRLLKYDRGKSLLAWPATSVPYEANPPASEICIRQWMHWIMNKRCLPDLRLKLAQDFERHRRHLGLAANGLRLLVNQQAFSVLAFGLLRAARSGPLGLGPIEHGMDPKRRAPAQSQHARTRLRARTPLLSGHVIDRVANGLIHGKSVRT